MCKKWSENAKRRNKAIEADRKEREFSQFTYAVKRNGTIEHARERKRKWRKEVSQC